MMFRVCVIFGHREEPLSLFKSIEGRINQVMVCPRCGSYKFVPLEK